MEGGKWYRAKIGLVHKDGTYRVDWLGKFVETYTDKVPQTHIRTRKTGRSASLDELKGQAIPGVYVLNVPKCEKHWYKIGISEADIEKRVVSYITAYPWDFNVVAIMLFNLNIADWKRYRLIRDAEREILKTFAKSKIKSDALRMPNSEWVNLKTTAETNQLKDTMQKVADKHGAAFTWFGDTHTIKWPK